MPTTVAKIKKSGQLKLSGQINERKSVLNDALTYHYPLDGNTRDIMKGAGDAYNLSNNVNIMDQLANNNWKNPANWTTYLGTGNVVWDPNEEALRFSGNMLWLIHNNYIAVDTSKAWYISCTTKCANGLNTLFYLGTISYDASFNVLAGHPGTHDYFGASGANVPTLWTTYTNSAIGGAPRTGESSTTTDLATFHPGAVYVKFVLIANYPAVTGDTLWVKDLRLYTTGSELAPPFDPLGRGMAIEPAVTNYAPGASSFAGWNGYSNGNDGTSLNEFGVMMMSMRNRISWCGTYVSVSLPSTGVVTFSAYYRVNKVTSGMGVSVYTSGFGVADSASGANLSDAMLGKWQRISLTINATGTSGGFYLIQYGGDQSGNYRVTCDVCMPMVTMGDTTYTWHGADSGTSSHVRQDLIPLVRNPFSATGGGVALRFQVERFDPQADYTHIIDNGANGGAWWFAGIQAGNHYLYMHEPQGSVAYVSTFAIIRNVEYHLVLTWNSNTQYLYLNGTLLGTVATNSSYHISRIPYGQIRVGYPNNTPGGNPNHAQATIIRDLSFYNRMITSDEVVKLAKQSVKMTATDLITNFYKEEQRLPSAGAIYRFPLSSHGRDTSGNFGPINETYVEYQDGSAWVGGGVANLLASPEDFNTGNWSRASTALSRNMMYFGGQVYIFQDIALASGTWAMVTWRLAGTTPGQTIRVSHERSPQGGYDLTSVPERIESYSRYASADTSNFLRPLLYQFTGDNGNASYLRMISAQMTLTSFSPAFAKKSFSITKNAGGSSWTNADVWSTTGFKTCCLSFQAPRADNTGALMLGIRRGSFNPATSPHYNNAHYAWYPNEDSGPDVNIYEGDTYIGNYGAYNTGASVFAITYDGYYVRYYLDGVNHRTVYDPGQTMYMYGSFHYLNDYVSTLRFHSGDTFAEDFSSRSMTISSAYQRGSSLLSYNLNDHLGLAWSGNWTVAYWKKAVASEGGGLTGYSIDSLGCNGNTVGGSYVWWGKQSGSNELRGAGNVVTGTWGTYFEEWHFVCLRKVGSTLYTDFIGKDFSVRTSYGFSTGNSNGFVTQHGYDLQLGGYDRANPNNAYFRDLVVAKWALSDAEMNHLYSQASERAPAQSDTLTTPMLQELGV